MRQLIKSILAIIFCLFLLAFLILLPYFLTTFYDQNKLLNDKTTISRPTRLGGLSQKAIENHTAKALYVIHNYSSEEYTTPPLIDGSAGDLAILKAANIVPNNTVPITSQEYYNSGKPLGCFMVKDQLSGIIVSILWLDEQAQPRYYPINEFASSNKVPYGLLLISYMQYLDLPLDAEWITIEAETDQNGAFLKGLYSPEYQIFISSTVDQDMMSNNIQSTSYTPENISMLFDISLG